MDQFYISIVFLGIALIVFSLLWIVLDKKKSNDHAKSLEEKKEELVTIITDAEQMIDELNRFSDYIVTQMDLKNEELSSNLRDIDEKVKQISIKIHETDSVSAIKLEKQPGEARMAAGMDTAYSYRDEASVIDTKANNGYSVGEAAIKQPYRLKDKVIHLNSRYNEVIQLSRNGLNETDIAKRLNMGKGEIQLILQMNK